MCIRFTIHIPTVSYKHFSYLCYREIHLLGSFAAILLRSTRNTSFYYVLFVIITEICLSQKIRINSFVIFSNTVFCCRQVNLLPSKRFYFPHHNWPTPDGALSFNFCCVWEIKSFGR